MKPIILAVAYAMLLAFAAPVLATDPPPCPEVPACLANTYLLVTKDDGYICKEEKNCVPSYVSPEPVEIWCQLAGTEYHCEVWPQGDVVYHWESWGAVSLLVSGTTESIYQAIYCNGIGPIGSAKLTVTSPYGLSASKTVSFECGPPGPIQ